MTSTTYIKRGDIYYVDLGSERQRQGSIQYGIRPCVVCGNNLQNRFSEVIMISPITSSRKKKSIPTHLELKAEECNLKTDSTVLFEQIITIQKSQLREKISSLSDEIMQEVNDKLMISLGIAPAFA
ncbi:MAG: type II toxin-antitoxin system PemK/MazF family toxin [Clostridia bacterium]|nr:type II toxin-antitoxin system PemK/MazF family toxin [Clostridia bacterium]